MRNLKQIIAFIKMSPEWRMHSIIPNTYVHTSDNFIQIQIRHNKLIPRLWSPNNEQKARELCQHLNAML